MSRVVLGNRNATDSTDNGVTRFALPKGKRATVIDIPEEATIYDALVAITAPDGVWAAHTSVTDEKTGELTALDRNGKPHRPAWVASDDPALASVLAAHFGGIEIRDLEEVK